MPELHLLVVFDTDTRTYHLADLAEAPVDSDASVWDAAADEWRTPTDAERDLYMEAESALGSLLATGVAESAPRDRLAP
jgi:hypothetical protein